MVRSEQADAGESIFFQEWVASGRHRNILSISAVCNNRCIFCSNDLNPFPIRSGIFRDLEDIKYQLSLMEIHQGPIFMSESLPGRIAEGEAFLHPQLFEILGLVRRKFLTNRLLFTTNGSMLDESFLKELSRFRPIEINLSMHSTVPELWARIFGRNEKVATKTIETLDLIKKYRFDLAGSIVTLPKICGWEDVERTYDHLVGRGADQMFLWWPGYTVMTPPGVREELECPIDEYLAFAERMRTKHGKTLWLQPDMNLPSRVPVKRIMESTLKGNLKNLGGPYRRVLWLTSEAAYPVLQSMIEAHCSHFPNAHFLAPARNLTYGGNIICSGLLMVDDLVRAGKEALEQRPDTELVLVPKTPFDKLLRDLQKVPALRIAEELERPVWLVDPDRGDCDVLLDVPMVRTGQADVKALAETMNMFNRAGIGKAELEMALDLIDTYPVRTSWGDLSWAALQEKLSREGFGIPGQHRLLDRKFEMLGGARALCTELWSTQDQDLCSRWTFLVRRESGWKIERLERGEENA